MYIKSLHLENFRCYEKLDMDFEPKLTVIVGDNGRGKTAIFDALAKAFAPYLTIFGLQAGKISSGDARNILFYDQERRIKGMEARYPVVIHAEGCLDEGNTFSWSCRLDGEDELSYNVADDGRGAALVENFKTWQTNEALVLLVLGYYGTQRIWQDSSLLQKYQSVPGRLRGYIECLEPSSSYNTFLGWLRDCRDEELLAAVDEALNICLAHTGWSSPRYNEAIDKIVVTHPDYGELPITDALSDGSRAIISMVTDIAYRMVRLNPQLGRKAPQLTPGIVLIDEVDMHLYPAWQQTIVGDLTAIFPQVQFILTTHSPQVLSTVPASSIRILEWDKEERGKVWVRRPGFSLGAESYQLLKDIQHVETRAANLPIVQQLHRYLELVAQDRWDSEEAQSLRKILNEWSQGKEPALLRADMDIRLRRAGRRSR